MSVFNATRRLSSVLALLALAGCAGYRLGTPVPPEMRTVCVPVFENASGQPEAESIVSHAVLQEFRREGTMRIAERADAALIVEGRVVECRLEPMRYDRDQPYLAIEYRLLLTADVKVVEAATGKVVARLGRVTGSDLFRTQSDLPSTRRDALPRAAYRLARQVVSGTVSAWW